MNNIKKSTIKGARILLLTGLFILLKSNLYAQSNKNYLTSIGEVDSLYSSVLEESREIYIQLPSSYTPGSSVKYPVVYVLDGKVLLPAVQTVHEFYHGGFMPEMVLVGIANNKNRTRDLTSSEVKTRHGRPLNEENGQAEKFTTFLEKELIPFIAQKYPVTDFRTLIGHSYAGLFTINSLVHHSQLFTNYLAIDPSLDWDNQKLSKQAQVILASGKLKKKRLFISLNGQLHRQKPEITIENVMEDATEHTVFARSNIAFSDNVKENLQNVGSFDWKFYPNDLHGTIPLPSIMDGLISLFDWYQMENTSKFNAPDTSRDELYEIVNYRAQKLFDHFNYKVPPYPEHLLNILGYMSLEIEQYEKSKMFFEFVLEYYPESPNAYDAMADYFLAQQDQPKALKYLQTAYELSGSNYHKERIDTLMKKADNE